MDPPHGGKDLQRPVHLEGRPKGLPEEMRRTPRALEKPEERGERSRQASSKATKAESEKVRSDRLKDS